MSIETAVLPITVGDGRTLQELRIVAGLRVWNENGNGGGEAGGYLGSFIEENKKRVSKKLARIEIELLYFGHNVVWKNVKDEFNRRNLGECEPEDTFHVAIKYPEEPCGRKYIAFVHIENALYVENYLGSYFFPSDVKRNATNLIRTKDGGRVIHLMNYNPDSSGGSKVWFAGRRL